MNDVNAFQIIHRKHILPVSLPLLIRLIHEHKHFLFVKYGDGEYECMLKQENASSVASAGNCDADVYFPELANDLWNSFSTLIQASTEPSSHIFIGKWHFPKEIEYLAKKYYLSTLAPTTLIPFVPYHLVMNDAEALQKDDMRNFVQALRDASPHLIKIVLSNSENNHLQSIFLAQHFVTTPPRCLYLTLDSIMEEVYQIIDGYPSTQFCLLTSCGLAAKVTIARAFQKYGNRLCAIDIGSSFDLLCKKRVTRQYQLDYSYEDIQQYYAPLK